MYFLNIYSYIQYFVFGTYKSCQRDVIERLEVLKIIPRNQLILCLICDFS